MRAESQQREWRHRASRKKNAGLPGSERVQPSPWRILAVVAVAVVAMFAGLQLAVKYAEKDWAAKNAAAHGVRTPPPAKSEEGEATEGEAAGWRYDAAGRDTEAMAVAGRPGSGRSSWAAAAAAAAKSGNGREARMAVRMATACGGDWAAAVNLEGTLDLDAGRTADARRRFRAAARTNRSAAYNLAVCDWAEGRRAEAVAGMAAFAMRKDADTGATRTLGRWLWQSGRRKEAVELLRRQAGDGSPLLLDLATYEALRGEKQTAVRTLGRALDGVPLTAVIHTFQSPAFREASLTEEGRAMLGELANRARQTLGAGAAEGQREDPTGGRRGVASSVLLRR